MNRFIRYWNQNRIKIIITILIIAFIIILIQVINNILKQVQSEIPISNTVIKDTSIPDESVITGEKLPEEKTESNVNIIEEFVNYSNKKEYEKAYNLLSQECKDELYSTLDDFIVNYCNKIFYTEKTYNLELWQYTTNAYTYKIIYTENNILSTGNINSGNNIEDYITIVESSNGCKLNLNKLIEKKVINKTIEQDGIQISIIERTIYNDYEKYKITFKNNTNNTILLNEGTNGNDICLIDKNETEYDSIINEIPLINLELKPGIQKTLEIRFYKMYNLYRTINNINFRNIILDKESYSKDKNNARKISISIDI